jgi:elongation factor P hydroxylase
MDDEKPNCEVYAYPDHAIGAAMGIYTAPRHYIDFRPWCSEHGLMARGNGYWYCEDCDEISIDLKSEKDVYNPAIPT